ncbi:MAG: hypothetical protein LKJ25_00885 [Clostridia bacterium]|jgi:hypothetical protein|nr:hypothetical protein [Clostridia bacterium]
MVTESLGWFFAFVFLVKIILDKHRNWKKEKVYSRKLTDLRKINSEYAKEIMGGKRY